jgi:hypothetical protein
VKQWLLHSADGVPRGPVGTVDIARAVHAGILGRNHHVAPTSAPWDWRPIASIAAIERAIDELAFPENDAGDEALRTLIASPAELASLAPEPQPDAAPDSMDDVRRLAPTAHAAPRARAGASAPPSDDGPDSEPRTLIAPSPFDDAPAFTVPTEPEPVYVVMPQTPPARPAAGASASASRASAVFGEAPTVLATPEPRIREKASAPSGESSGTNPGVAKMATSRRRVYMALAFMGGLVGGFAMLLVVYALVGP